MKNYFRLVSSSCLGTFAAIALIFLVFMVIGAISSSSANKITGDGILMLDFSSPIPELTDNVEVSPFDMEAKSAVGLRHYKKLIEHAADHSSIKGIVIKTPLTGLGQAKASAIRKSLQKFKDNSDKFIYTYGDFYSQTGYYLSSVADSIFLNPLGMVDMRGKATLIPFYKKMMDKFGIDMNIFYAGDFKSGTEPYRRESMSEQSKIQLREYLNEMYDIMLDDISASRGLSKTDLDDIIDNFKLETAEAAKSLNIIDDIKYYHEFEDILRTSLGLKKGKTIKYIEMGEFASKVKLPKKGSGIKDKIAIVYAEGNINYANDDKGQISEKKYHKIFNKISKDKKVKAIVFRINSPGGNAFSSDEIWNELMKIKKEKEIPIIASFGNYAASGGYYIAMCADTIVSEEATLTGSIGVYSMIPNMRILLSDKLGITFDTVKTARHAVGPTLVYDFNDEEKAIWQRSTDRMYDIFLSRVAEGRNMSKEAVHEIAQGRVWTGRKAQSLGLVDEIGDLDDALAIAAEKAGLESYKVTEYPRIKKSVFEEMIKSFSQSQDVSMLDMDPIEKSLLQQYQSVKTLVKDPHPMARLPYMVEY